MRDGKISAPDLAGPRARRQHTSRHVAKGLGADGNRNSGTRPYGLFAGYRIETCFPA